MDVTAENWRALVDAAALNGADAQPLIQYARGYGYVTGLLVALLNGVIDVDVARCVLHSEAAIAKAKAKAKEGRPA